jgi:N4-gp56 family major capsid protein
MALNPMKTTTTSIAVGMQTFCDKIMLARQKAVLVHDQGAVSKPIPAKSGKIHQMRRYTPLPVVIADLTLQEGTIPDGQAITEEQVLAYIYQYGGYTSKTDLVDLTHMDMETAELADLLGQQGAELKDMVIREEMATTTTVQYAGSKTHIYDLETTDELNVDEIRKMIRTLKQNKTPAFSKGGKSYFLGIVGPEAEFDIMSDTNWKYPKEYVDTQDIYNGELGMLYGVRFLQTTECKKYENEELIDGQTYLTSAGAIAGTTITVDEVITAAEATALVDRYVNIWVDATHYERQKITAAAAGAAGAATITLDAAPSGSGVTVADGTLIYANEYGFSANPVYTTFVFGRNAYSIGGIKGSDKIVSIVKAADSGGVSNPLNQFGTIGWKIPAMSVKVLQPLWLGQILHGASA